MPTVSEGISYGDVQDKRQHITVQCALLSEPYSVMKYAC